MALMHAGEKAITLEIQNLGSTKVTFRSIPKLILSDGMRLVGIVCVRTKCTDDDSVERLRLANMSTNFIVCIKCCV